MGSEEKIFRKRKREHEDESIKDHLELTKRKLLHTRSELAEMKDRVISLETVVHQLMSQQSSSVSRQDPSWSITLAAAAAAAAPSGTPVCPCIIKVPDYDRLSRDEVFCAYFYTHQGGYLIQLCANLVGDEEAPDTKNLLIQLCLLEGPHDDGLSWPLRGKFEVDLLNHLSNQQHCTDVFIYNDDHGNRVVDDYDELARSLESYPFIKEDQLNQDTGSSIYLQDNCLYISITAVLKHTGNEQEKP